MKELIKKSLLTKKHIKARYDFDLKHESWTVDDWKHVLFSDETKLNKRGSGGKVWTWRRPGESGKPKHAKQAVKHDSYVMAWGCFNATGTNMYIIVLLNYMILSAGRLFQESYIFQYDNDPKHAAKN